MEIFKKYYLTQRKTANQVNPNTKRIRTELIPLQLLQDKFINEPRLDHYPFPKLIQIPHKELDTELCECYDCQLQPDYHDKWYKQYPNIQERYRQIGRKIRFDLGHRERPVIPCHYITMTHCGMSLTPRNFKNLLIRPINLYNTVECIINNLRNLKLIHHDIRGSNICINKNGNISLIDFKSARHHPSHKVNAFYKKPDLLDQEVDIGNRFPSP